MFGESAERPLFYSEGTDAKLKKEENKLALLAYLNVSSFRQM